VDPRKIAILIGIDDYERCGPLSFCVQDVEALGDILLDSRRGGYEPDYVKTLTDREEQKPHRTNIRQTVQNVAAMAKPVDEILFYFSGHGLTHEKRAYIIPYEGSSDDPNESCVALDWIQSQLEQSKASVKVLILDACHSGLEMGKPASGAMSKEFDEALKSLSRGVGSVVLSSCQASEVSYEVPEMRRGIFSYHFTQGLSGLADTNGDYFVSVTEAYTYTHTKVQDWAIRENRKQTPTFYSKIAGDIKLVAVPRPIVVPEIAFPTSVLRVRLRTKPDSILAYSGEIDAERMAKYNDHAKKYGLGLLGVIGASLAKLFGPENVKPLDELTRSFPRGKAGVSIIHVPAERLGKLTNLCVALFIEIEFYGNEESTTVANEEALFQLIDFDEMEYHISVPVDLVATYRFVEKTGLEISSYGPPNHLEATSKTARLVCDNTTTDAKIRIALLSKADFRKTEMKHFMPSGIRDMIRSHSHLGMKG
jgi:hypothetical protein